MLERTGGGAGEVGFAAEMSTLKGRIEELRQVPETDSDVRDAYVVDLENMHEELRVADEEIRAQQEEVERLLDMQRSAQWQRERLIAVLPAAVLVTDSNGTIRSANAAAADLLGRRVDMLLRKPLPVHVEPEDRRELRRLISRLNEGEDSCRTTVTIRRSRTRPVRVEAVAQAAGVPRTDDRTMTWLLLSPPSEQEAASAPAKPALAHAFSQLTRVPLHSSGKREVLVSVATICAQAFGPGTAVSVGVGRPTDPEHIGSNCRLAQDLDGVQMIAGEGPCQTAWQTCTPVLSPDVRNDERWPRLAARIADKRVGSVIALPVLLGDDPIGSLTVYAEPGRRLGEAQVRIAQLMGATVAAILHEMDQKMELETLTGQLQEALKSRAVIDQAKGMIMLRDRCDADTAFRKLVQVSSHGNVKLREVAQKMVDSAALGQ